MAYRCGKARQDKKAFSSTFPLDAELDEGIVEQLSMGPALNRMAAQLMKQYSKAGPRPDGTKKIIGVNFVSISFTFELETEQQEERR